jgi:hypothetical protein
LTGFDVFSLPVDGCLWRECRSACGIRVNFAAIFADDALHKIFLNSKMLQCIMQSASELECFGVVSSSSFWWIMRNPP